MVSNSALRAGMKVVCVADDPSYINGVRLELRKVYTVEAVVWGGGALVLLDGPHSGFLEGGAWHKRHFRPAVESKTKAEDMAVFRGMLDINPDTKLTILEEMLNQ